MKNVTTEIKVGIFTLIALSAIVYMFFVLSPDLLDSEKENKFYTIVDNASGIVAKTHVRTNGVTVGKVQDVVLESSHTRIEFTVRERVKIPAGSKIEIRTRGLLGETFLEIVRAPDVGQYIEPGKVIPMNSEKVGMSQLIGIVGDIAKDIKKVTSTLAGVLGSQDGKSSFAAILQNLESSSANLKYILEDNRGDLRVVIANLKQFTGDMTEVLDRDNKEKLDRILAKFETTIDDVQSSASSVKLVSQKIEKGEGTIGQLINDDAAIEELKAAIADVREVISPATKLKIDVAYQGEIRNDATTQHYFNLVFRTRPDKFYLLGFTDLSENRKESVKTETVDGETTNTTETYSVENALRFNFQFGKRWSNLALRFGLFESTGGIGMDYFFLDDRFKLTFEAFDWESDSEIRNTAHMKAYASILFLDHIFAIIGVDDLTRKDSYIVEGESRRPRPFFGAGLNFTDDDLKAVLGTAALAL